MSYTCTTPLIQVGLDAGFKQLEWLAWSHSALLCAHVVRDVEVVETELVLADMQTAEKRLAGISKKVLSAELISSISTYAHQCSHACVGHATGATNQGS